MINFDCHSKVVNMVFGSRLYGLATEDSDLDYQGVYLPTKKDILLQAGNGHVKRSTGDTHERNTSEDTDLTMFSLHKFLKMAEKGETEAIDMLHAPTYAILESSPLWEEIQANRSLFYTRNMSAFVKYVRGQADKYGIKGSRVNAIEQALNGAKEAYRQVTSLRGGSPPKVEDAAFYLPTDGEYLYFMQKNEQLLYCVCDKKYQASLKLEDLIDKLEKKWETTGERARQAARNEGIDWKAVSHALRAGYQMRSMYKVGDIRFPLDETDFIMDVKLGNLDYKSQVEPEVDRIVQEVEELAKQSNYPDEVDSQMIDNWIVDIYNRYIGFG